MSRPHSPCPVSQQCGRASFLKTAALLLALVLWLSNGEQAQAQPSKNVTQAFYYGDLAKDERIPVWVAEDHLALLMDGSATEDDLRSQLFGKRAQGVREVERISSRLALLHLDEGVSKTAREALLAELSGKSHRGIVRAGAAVYLEDANLPLVLSQDWIVQLREGKSRQDLEAFNLKHGFRVQMENPFVPGQFLLVLDGRNALDAMQAANLYAESGLVAFSQPNFATEIQFRQTIPDDHYFTQQWHHRNTGQGNGTADADIDTPLAWDLTLGDPDTVIAVLDSGFDTGHPDLLPNFWQNEAELNGLGGVDDDGNDYVDDLNGWDFTGCDSNPVPGCGDPAVSSAGPTDNDHGTAVAGAAAARGDNSIGVSGSCPLCSLMLVRIGGNDFSLALAFGYAQDQGAEIITNSWGFPMPRPCPFAVCNAIDDAANNGSVVLFAMNTTNRPGTPYTEDCLGNTPDISSRDTVIAVSASNNADQRTPAGYGDCMDVVAPTDGAGTTRGTLWAVTTDRRGAFGYNYLNTVPPNLVPCPVSEPGTPPADAREYTYCFGGTSFSTPETAGVAGLMLSTDSTLDRHQVQRALQDTSDKIEDSAASYVTATGFSQPSAPPQTGLPVGSTHGWGRINAYEAVRTVAPRAEGGRGGKDIFVRDNRLDWGNTEQLSNVLMEPDANSDRGFIPHWQSVDIKVDAPPYQTPPTDHDSFEALVDENPQSMRLNRVYLRVRNRGPRTVNQMLAKMHWAFAGTALPPLPQDFWPMFPNDSIDTSRWHPLGIRNTTNLRTSGASLAGCPGRGVPDCAAGSTDDAQILMFLFPGPPLDLSRPSPRHYCLLAILDSAEDPVDPASRASLNVDWITPRDNNVTHRNLFLADPVRFFEHGVYEDHFLIRNPTEDWVNSSVQIKAPPHWNVQLSPISPTHPVSMQPGEEILVTIQIQAPPGMTTGEVSVYQVNEGAVPPHTGGVTYSFEPRP